MTPSTDRPVSQCKHWWRRKSEFFGVTGCRKCLDKIEFRVEMVTNNIVKNSMALFDHFNKLPKETQDLILSKMSLGSIHDHR